MDSPRTAFRLPKLTFGHILVVVVVAIFIQYTLFIARHMGAFGGGSDSSGYLNNARLLAIGKADMPQRVLPGVDTTKIDPCAFVPLGFRPMENFRTAPSYPIGLPMAIAAMALVTGWDAAPHITMALFGLLGLVLTAALGRSGGLPWSWSWFGAFILGASPLYTFLSIQLMSDVPAAVLALATILCAARSRERTVWALLAGAVMAGGVLTRPSNLVMLFPVAVCFGLSWRRWVLFLLGGLPGALLQCFYNWYAYGDPLESGYGGAGSLFRLENIPGALRNYGQWLPVLLTPIGLFAVALPWAGRRDRFAWMLVTWIVAIFGFYMLYFHTHEAWWYLRFVMPAFPACIIGGLWVIHGWWVRRKPGWYNQPIVARLFAAALAFGVFKQSKFWHLRLDASTIGRGEGKYHNAINWARDHLPANSVLAVMQCSGAVVYYSDFTFIRWDVLQPGDAALLERACLAAGRPIYAVLWPFEVKDATEVKMPGRWTQVGNVLDVTIWQWAPATP